MPGANLFVAAGAAIGAGVGAAAGFGISRMTARRAAPPSEPDRSPAATPLEGPEEPDGGPKALPSPQPASAAKHVVFDVGTYYLTTNSEFYTPLDRFYNMLQFKEERIAFADIVVAIDGILGMEILLNARNPITAAQIPKVAQRARNKAKQALYAIIDFSDERRPSPTKKSTMRDLAESMLKVIDEIILQMHTTIAAEPITEQKA